MDKNLMIQYTAVGIIILAAIIWIVVKMFTKKDKGGSCHGCSLSENCTKVKEKRKHSSAKDCKDHK